MKRLRNGSIEMEFFGSFNMELSNTHKTIV